jgi:enoyl-CoA hydratase/carnithine racemase
VDELKLAFADRIATLTIDRPQRRNAMSYEMWSAVPDLMSRVAASGVRVLVVRGTEHFSAGADISEFATLRNGPDGARRYSETVHAGERAIVDVPVPTIAAINGYCIGGGCEIALACDVRIASSDARFGITPAKLGIVYNFTSTRQLVAAVGPSWAKQILFGGDLIDAATASRIGLVNEVHADADARVAELAGTIASRAPVSVRGAKEIVNRIAAGQDDEDEGVRELYEAAVMSDAYAEGVAAFLAKRTPRF